MNTATPLKNSQRIARAGVFRSALIALSGGSLQMCLGLASCGRLLSIRIVGLPEPPPVWLGHLVPEMLVPMVLAAAHFTANRSAAA
jgi:hypothetical protein